MRPERLERVRVRRGEEREKENSDIDRFSLSMAQRRPDKPRTERGSRI